MEYVVHVCAEFFDIDGVTNIGLFPEASNGLTGSPFNVRSPINLSFRPPTHSVVPTVQPYDIPDARFLAPSPDPTAFMNGNAISILRRIV